MRIIDFNSLASMLLTVWRTQSISFWRVLQLLSAFAILFSGLAVIHHIDNVIYSEWIKSVAMIGTSIVTVITCFTVISLEKCGSNANEVQPHWCCLHGSKDGNATIDLSGKSSPLPCFCVAKSINVIRDGKILTVIITDYGEIPDIMRIIKDRGHTLIEYKENDGKHILSIRIGKNAKNNLFNISPYNEGLELDVSNFDSPVPELLTRKILDVMANGKVLKVISKEYSREDICSLINNIGCTLIEKSEENDRFIMKILVVKQMA